MSGTFLDSALDILARTVLGEARNQPREGRTAIAHVAINRATIGFHGASSIPAACLAPFQFSCWNSRDPNCQYIQAATVADPAFADAIQVAQRAMQADDPDPTKGATHYHTVEAPKGASEWPPRWAQGHEPVATIGDHVFYKGIA